MATALTNRKPPSRQHHLLSAQSSLPFPTSPAMPGRRTRLKVSNHGQSSGGTARPGSRIQVMRSQTANSFEGRDSSGLFHLSIIASGSEDDVNTTRNSNYTSIRASRSHRNIVTSRRKADVSSSMITQSSLTSSSDNRDCRINKSGDHDADKLFLPTTSFRQTADPPPLPQGVFLTSLIFEDSPIDPVFRSSSDSSRDVTSTHTSLEGQSSSSHHQLPVSVTSGDNASTSTALMPRNTFGLQRVYMEGLDYMRNHVLNVEKSVDAINRQFHKVIITNSEEDWLHYLGHCNQQLLQANVSLLKSGLPLEVVDSEASLVKLINNLRADDQPDKIVVDFLTKFWDELKLATHELQVLLDKFNCAVLHRISSNYMSSQISELQVPVCQKYALDITDFQKSLELQLTSSSLLLKNYRPTVGTEIADKSPFSERLMVFCDLKAFPILRFVSEICEKITGMCQTARNWLARDEQFMSDVQEFIRETRNSTRQRERVLHAEKMKQKKVEKNVKVAHSILRHNRSKLSRIEIELQELEHQLNTSKEEQRARFVEIQHKETMVDFLKVTLQQTRKNCRLQTKRTRLLRQVKELEQYLKLMETDLEVVQDQILAKSHEKILLTDKISTSEKSYGFLKSDLDRFSENLEELEAEVSGLSGQLLQLEIVHTIRTSPEILDNLTDRPSTVKLSKSLKDRIKQRVKKAVTMNR